MREIIGNQNSLYRIKLNRRIETMKITYEPIGINNFHDSPNINLIVSGETATGFDDPVYLISKAQARRIEKHFCGITDCRCPAGAAIQLDESGTEFGIRVKWCGGAE